MPDRFFDAILESCEGRLRADGMIVLREDDKGVKLYDSTLQLPALLRELLRVRPRQGMDDLYARFWRDALVIVLRHLRHIDAKQHEQLARILAAELLGTVNRVTSYTNLVTGVSVPPKIALARSMGQDLKKLLHRTYSRGSLKPIDSQAPLVLRLWCLQAEKALQPLSCSVAETLWRRMSPKRFPADLWANLNAAKGVSSRAKVFVAAVNGCSRDSLNRTLQRSRRRSSR